MAQYRVLSIPAPRALKELHEAWIPSQTPTGRPISATPFDDTAATELDRFSYELALHIATGRAVHPTVPSIKELWGHLNLVYVPIVDLPPLRSALLWHRRMREPTVRDLIETAREVIRAKRRR